MDSAFTFPAEPIYHCVVADSICFGLSCLFMLALYSVFYVPWTKDKWSKNSEGMKSNIITIEEYHICPTCGISFNILQISDI